jgi:hypothetical protein
MTKLAGLVHIFVAGIAKASGSSEDSMNWDEASQTLNVRLEKPMYGDIATTSRVPIKFHVQRTLEFKFVDSQDGIDGAVVKVKGFWVGPFAGVHRFLGRKDFKEQLAALMNAGLAELKPYEDRLDEALAELSKICGKAYKSELRDSWTDPDPKETKISEFLDAVFRLMATFPVNAVAKEQDFHDVIFGVAGTLPAEVIQLTAVDNEGDIQIQAKKKPISTPIPELMGDDGSPVLTDAEYNAMLHALDRSSYVAMAVPVQKKPIQASQW